MYIIFCSCGFYLLLLSSFFLAYSQQSDTGCLPYFHTWCGLSANLECMSEMCCMQLAENTGCKNYTKNRHLRTIAQCSWATGISSQLKHVSTIGKNLLNSNISPTCRYNMVNFGLLAADRFVSLGHPCKFQRVSRLGSVTAWHSGRGRQRNFAALNRGRHLYSRWALAHILVCKLFYRCISSLI